MGTGMAGTAKKRKQEREAENDDSGLSDASTGSTRDLMPEERQEMVRLSNEVGWTQAQLGEQFDVSRSAVQRCVFLDLFSVGFVCLPQFHLHQ